MHWTWIPVLGLAHSHHHQDCQNPRQRRPDVPLPPQAVLVSVGEEQHLKRHHYKFTWYSNKQNANFWIHINAIMNGLDKNLTLKYYELLTIVLIYFVKMIIFVNPFLIKGG